MEQSTLKARLAVVLIIFHVVVVLFAIFLGVGNYIEFDEMTTTIAIVLPLFAGYTTAILKYYLNNPVSPPEPEEGVATPLVVMSVVFPAALALVVLGSMVGLWLKTFDDFEQFKSLLGFSEAAFGIYLAQLVSGLFPGERPQTGSPPTTHGRHDPPQV